MKYRFGVLPIGFSQFDIEEYKVFFFCFSTSTTVHFMTEFRIDKSLDDSSLQDIIER